MVFNKKKNLTFPTLIKTILTTIVFNLPIIYKSIITIYTYIN